MTPGVIVSSLMQAKFGTSENHLQCALALNRNDPRLVLQRGINLTFLGDLATPWTNGPCGSTRSPRIAITSMVRALFLGRTPRRGYRCPGKDDAQPLGA